MLARHLDGFVLMPQYRLSSTGDEGARFPAALQDVLTAYKYVLGLGVAAEDIVLSGDSRRGQLGLGGCSGFWPRKVRDFRFRERCCSGGRGWI